MANIVLAPDVKQELLNRLHSSKEWKDILVKFHAAKKSFNLKEVERLNNLLDSLEEEVLRNYASAMCDTPQETESMTLHDLLGGMSPEDKDKMLAYVHGVVMTCEALDGFIRDADSLLKKYYSDTELVFYEKLKELGKEVVHHTSTLTNQTDAKNTNIMYHYSDKLYAHAQKLACKYYEKIKKLTKAKP